MSQAQHDVVFPYVLQIQWQRHTKHVRYIQCGSSRTHWPGVMSNQACFVAVTAACCQTMPYSDCATAELAPEYTIALKSEAVKEATAMHSPSCLT